MTAKRTKTTSDIGKTMSHVEKIMSDIIQITSDLFSLPCNLLHDNSLCKIRINDINCCSPKVCANYM